MIFRPASVAARAAARRSAAGGGTLRRYGGACEKTRPSRPSPQSPPPTEELSCRPSYPDGPRAVNGTRPEPKPRRDLRVVPTASPATAAGCDRGGRALRLPACRRFRERARRDEASGGGPTAGRREGEPRARRGLLAPGRLLRRHGRPIGQVRLGGSPSAGVHAHQVRAGRAVAARLPPAAPRLGRRRTRARGPLRPGRPRAGEHHHQLRRVHGRPEPHQRLQRRPDHSHGPGLGVPARRRAGAGTRFLGWRPRARARHRRGGPRRQRGLGLRGGVRGGRPARVRECPLLGGLHGALPARPAPPRPPGRRRLDDAARRPRGPPAGLHRVSRLLGAYLLRGVGARSARRPGHQPPTRRCCAAASP